MAHEKVLIIEDEKDLVKLLRYNLEKEGYLVKYSYDGETGLEMFRKEKPAVVLLDVMLPKIDGFELCKMIRQESQTPIIMVTAKKEEVDRILGLELGADDYVTKPFSVREVTARIKAILRRSGDKKSGKEQIVRAGDLEVDMERYETRVKDKVILLSSREFEFLKHLLLADGRALNRDQLLEHVWGYDKSVEIDSRTIDQHIARLRDKLGTEGKRIVTVKNVGYRIRLD